LQYTGHHLQQSTFAGAIFANDAEGFAVTDFEADIVQCPEILVALEPVKREQLLQPVAR
jgi:hypothetical protein